MKAYYGIGGITPVHQLAEFFEGNKDTLKYDAYEAQESDRSMFKVSCEVETFFEAKAFFDRITKLLWDTIWKEVDGGYTYCGCCNEEDEEVEDDDGNDYSTWERLHE